MIKIIIGKQCSGKTTIANKLIEEMHYKKLTTYTSRPPRDGEIDGADYHFISRENFKEKITDDFFIEWKQYSTVQGVWYYGISKEDFAKAERSNDNYVLIVTPQGLKDIQYATGKTFNAVYIYTNITTIKNRSKKRGDSKDEVERRIKADNADFKGADKLVDRIIYNNEADDIESVMDKVVQVFGG